MQNNYSLADRAVHLYRVLLSDFMSREAYYESLLSPDELARADRFHFPVHRTRFILTRGILRDILSRYIQLLPNHIEFQYGARGKPFLSVVSESLQFNISHSEDVAVFALTRGANIGVDIQKIDAKLHQNIAERFFSKAENAALAALAEAERVVAFYYLWASKEALIKATGEGLFVPLGDFSVALNENPQWITLHYEQRVEKYFLQNFFAYEHYQASFATNQVVDEVVLKEW